MNFILEGETFCLEVGAEGKIWKPTGKSRDRWHFSRDASGLGCWLSMPFGYFSPSLQWFRRDYGYAPKYSRSKRLTLTIEHGQVKGYKE